MNIPKNMTREEVMEKIELVVGRIAPKYAFHGYDVDDIKQEAFIICMDALDRYDQKRPLENFLSVNLSNRLKNFVRDNFFVGQDDNKRNVLCPKQLTFEAAIAEECDYNLDRTIDFHSLQSIIDKHLPAEYRSDYLKILSDVYISKKRREHIIEVIKGIINENG
tara:strand:- start:207 stop:698 length:492 start_codon:yes stop_codon:yes gene_type:complete